MSSNNNQDHATRSLIDPKPTLTCTVSHTVSAPSSRSSFTPYKVKMVLFFLVSVMCIVGSILACSTSHNIKPFVALPPQGPEDGRWSDWNQWSQCSISCSNHNQPFGSMTRIRYCNSPPPQEGGKQCQGSSEEKSECFKSLCPIPIDGNWAEWSPWTQCSATCQSNGYIPTQQSSSSCSNPEPKDGGKLCEGRNIKERFCSWLPYCPIDGEWGVWYVAGPCESVNRKSCAIGKRLYQRQCNNPSPSPNGKECEGIKEKNEDCWFEIGCPADLQPPLDLQVFGNGSGLFRIDWTSVPYGLVATKYRIYLTIEDGQKNEIETVHQNITAVPSVEATGRKYSTLTDLRRFMKNNNFVTLFVRMSSLDYWNKESTLTKAVPSKAKAIDGQWGSWGHWSECSTTCVNKRGLMVRRRKCDNPSPAEGGKLCYGKYEEEGQCIGMASDC